MLKQLYIKNFTLIDELNIKLYPGFSVITGETGAGKSIILGAIGLLLGNRADTKAIKAGCARCTIEAHFDLSRYDLQDFFTAHDIDYDAHDTILRRELTAAGKSRAFINDTPVPLAQLRELGESLVDIHSQHQNLLLQKEDFQLSVVDILAADRASLDAYRRQFSLYRTTADKLQTLKNELAQSHEKEDFLRFQFQELEDARLQAGEQEQLEQESETLSHSEEIKSAYYEADKSLSGDDYGILQLLRSAHKEMESISAVYPEAVEIAERMDNAYIELKDIAHEISTGVENIEFDPHRLEEVNNRIDTLYSLQQKYHVADNDALMALHEDIRQQLARIDHSDEDMAELAQQVEVYKQAAEKQAAALSKLRQSAARKIEAEMKQRLVPLGIPNVRFEINFNSKPLSSDGIDKVSFLFSANKSGALQPVSQVASGGEIARVMLSLKAMISGAVKLPTIVFDEIDTGVSGKIAEKMADIMAEMGQQERQVISITHLPQIAAKGVHHYKVLKEETDEGTRSHMHELSPEERVHEIAQMLSGSDISQAALANAQELLKSGSV